MFFESANTQDEQMKSLRILEYYT